MSHPQLITIMTNFFRCGLCWVGIIKSITAAINGQADERDFERLVTTHIASKALLLCIALTGFAK